MGVVQKSGDRLTTSSSTFSGAELFVRVGDQRKGFADVCTNTRLQWTVSSVDQWSGVGVGVDRLYHCIIDVTGQSH